jgi:hypothetical protein
VAYGWFKRDVSDKRDQDHSHRYLEKEVMFVVKDIAALH